MTNKPDYHGVAAATQRFRRAGPNVASMITAYRSRRDAIDKGGRRPLRTRMAASLLTLVGTAVVTFVLSNLDDLAVLIALSSDAGYRTRQIVLGQFLGMSVLTGISGAAGLLAILVPSSVVGAIGIVPIGIGLVRLLRRPRPGVAATGTGLAGVLSVTGVTIANGGDNIAIYVPLFATATPAGMLVIAAVFFVLTGLWIAAARRFVRHPTWGPFLQRWGQRAVPWVLMVLGTSILYRSGVLALLAATLAAAAGSS